MPGSIIDTALEAADFRNWFNKLIDAYQSGDSGQARTACNKLLPLLKSGHTPPPDLWAALPEDMRVFATIGLLFQTLGNISAAEKVNNEAAKIERKIIT